MVKIVEVKKEDIDTQPLMDWVPISLSNFIHFSLTASRANERL